MARGPGILAGVAFHDDGARHHVLGHAGADRARHTDRRLLVHAAAIVAGGALHGHVERRVEAHRDGVAALGFTTSHGSFGAVPESACSAAFRPRRPSASMS
jgi:hypothetical protein